jgi:cobalt/nickel transport system permease protein
MYLPRLEFKKDPLRGFDGRCRLLSAFILISAAVTTTSFFILVGIIVLCLPALIREPRVTLPRLAAVNSMAVALWLPVAAGFDPSGVLLTKALLYTLRLNCAALLAMVLVVPMGISVLAASMAGLKVPGKMVSLFLLTYRCIFLLHDRLFTALGSMGLRCTIKSDIYRWRSLAAVFASVLAGAAFRGKKVWTAMVCRGFDGTFPVTAALVWRFRDGLFLAACAVFLALVILNERQINGYGIWKNWF